MCNADGENRLSRRFEAKKCGGFERSKTGKTCYGRAVTVAVLSDPYYEIFLDFFSLSIAIFISVHFRFQFFPVRIRFAVSIAVLNYLYRCADMAVLRGPDSSVFNAFLFLSLAVCITKRFLLLYFSVRIHRSLSLFGC